MKWREPQLLGDSREAEEPASTMGHSCWPARWCSTDDAGCNWVPTEQAKDVVFPFDLIQKSHVIISIILRSQTGSLFNESSRKLQVRITGAILEDG